MAGRRLSSFRLGDWSEELGSRVRSPARPALALAGWVALTFCAAATGVFVSTVGWYAGLAKPSWNPPGWLFGPVWTLVYTMMSVAAWMVWREGGWKAQKRALGLYLAQWALNALWTPLFFVWIAFATVLNGAIWRLNS